MAPPTATAPSTALSKFQLHSPALTAPTAPLTLAATGAPTPLATLQALRAVLVAERGVALHRHDTRNGNKAILADRSAREKKAVDDLTTQKEVERLRRKEDAARQEREMRERLERERLRDELAAKKAKAEQFEREKLLEEADKRRKDELEREAAIRTARELKDAREAREARELKDAQEVKDRDHAKVQQVLELVRVNEAQRAEQHAVVAPVSASAPIAAAPAPVRPPPELAAAPPQGEAEPEDATMTDADLVEVVSDVLPPPAAKEESVPPVKLAASAEPAAPAPTPPLAPVVVEPTDGPLPPPPPSISILAVDSEPDDDIDEPIPLPRHKNSDMKKRKHGQIIDSDASDSDEPLSTSTLPQKIPKLDDQPSQPALRAPSPSPVPRPSPTPSRAASLTPAVERPPSPKDPYAHLTPLQRKLKEEKFIKHSIPTRPPATGTAQAFYLPTHKLVPPRPFMEPLPPVPKRQSEVAEDFSKAKPGNQISHNVFHTWADAYLRPFGEDDLAILAPKTEDIGPYLSPALGKHYTERWEDEDSGDQAGTSTSYASPLEPPVLPRIKPDHLTEDQLGMEHVFLGPLSERLVAALAFQDDGEPGDPREKVDRDDEAISTKLAVMDAVDLEERIKKELRFIGILGEEDVDWASREDDEVSSALRACQRLLHRQTAMNEARKAVLSDIVKDRMAYQDYEATRDAQERVIENGWTKRQRAGKKKGKGRERDRQTTTEPTRPPVSLALLAAVEKRHKLVSQFKPFFEDEEDRGRFYGIPETSVYAGLPSFDDDDLLALE